MQICISQSGTVVEQLFVVLRLAKRSDRIAFDGRVGAVERVALGFGIECAEPLQCPECMDGASALAKRTVAQGRDGFFMTALYQ